MTLPTPFRTTALALAGLALIGAGGCGSATDSATTEADQIVADAQAEADRIRAEAESEASGAAGAPSEALGDERDSEAAGSKLPDLVGKGLQYAQDTAQGAGFYNLTSHDATGRGRQQVWDRNWKVCTQKPKPGSTNTSAEVDFGTVKTDEQCPKRDQGTEKPKPAGETMPNLVGKSASVAEDRLPSASIDFEDGTGRDRMVLMASNWKVCSQKPSAGQSYGGVPVTLTVVKYGESC